MERKDPLCLENRIADRPRIGGSVLERMAARLLLAWEQYDFAVSNGIISVSFKNFELSRELYACLERLGYLADRSKPEFGDYIVLYHKTRGMVSRNRKSELVFPNTEYGRRFAHCFAYVHNNSRVSKVGVMQYWMTDPSLDCNADLLK